MTRLGLYGGSFDPIHRGHIEPVLAAVEQLELDRVLYLPTANPPHKTERRFAPAWRRFAMAEIALLVHPRLQVSDFELVSGPSYTIDTVEHYARLELAAELHLVVGADSLATLDRWHRWQDLFDRAQIAVLRRPGWSRQEVLAAASPELATKIDGSTACWIDNPLFEVSATDIRQRLTREEVVPADWAPEAVLHYARKYCLYR